MNYDERHDFIQNEKLSELNNDIKFIDDIMKSYFARGTCGEWERIKFKLHNYRPNPCIFCGNIANNNICQEHFNHRIKMFNDEQKDESIDDQKISEVYNE